MTSPAGPRTLSRRLRLALGTTVAVGGLVVGAATGVQALTGSDDSASASCGTGAKVKQPAALKDAIKKARALKAGPERAAAKAAIKKDILAGKYGEALQARAEKSRDKRLAALPPALRTATAKVQAMSKGDERSDAARQLRKDVLAGKYGADVQAKAKERAETRKADRAARNAASTPALKAARQKVAAITDHEDQRKAAQALRKEILAGTYGDKAKAYAEKRSATRAAEVKEQKAKAKERRAEQKKTCAKQD